MEDRFGRKIEYMRLSVTDRCNLRCRYCMPNGVELAGHSDMLSYEEFLRVCEAAVSLGIVNFKITGGEPLARKGCSDFAGKLKALPGVEQVTLTTNGLLLEGELDKLHAAGIDGVNISIDTMDAEKYRALTGIRDADVKTALRALCGCVERGIKTKVNAVLLRDTFDGIGELARLAQTMPVDVRFIELMPIGEGVTMSGVPMDEALGVLRGLWPDLRPTGEKRGNGPARYFAAEGLMGRIGFIDAVSHKFCDGCNRIRLTASGTLKPCLCFGEGADLRAALRSGADNGKLKKLIRSTIMDKPISHCFSDRGKITERKTMNKIGG